MTSVPLGCGDSDPSDGASGSGADATDSESGGQTAGDESAGGGTDAEATTGNGSTEGTGPDDTGTAGGNTGGGTDGNSAGETESGGDPQLPEPGPDAVVPLFEGAHIYFLGSDNQRQIDTEITFPDTDGAYREITLDLTLGCPNGLCDWWDRKGYIGIVENAGTDDEQVIELVRMMTPYRVGGTWSHDITGLRPLLQGTRTVRLFIDTWVGPGHENGDGWLVDATINMTGGLPDKLPLEVTPLWSKRTVWVGDPNDPVSEQMPPQTVSIHPEATGAEIFSILTGHGQGNSENCAEFCQKTHGFLVGDMPVQQLLWRDDCAENPINNQQGTWQYARAGWCPGAEVNPWVVDVSAGITPGESVTIAHDMSEYENTCRPDAPVCTGCALGSSCEYNGGNHTPPHVDTSVLLVTYRDLG